MTLQAWWRGGVACLGLALLLHVLAWAWPALHGSEPWALAWQVAVVSVWALLIAWWAWGMRRLRPALLALNAWGDRARSGRVESGPAAPALDAPTFPEVAHLHDTLLHLSRQVRLGQQEHDRVQGQLLSARERAESAAQTKSQFLAHMSHELRTPVHGILGLTHLALDTPLTAQQTDYLLKVDRAAKQLIGVLNDVLDFSKIEAGRIDLDPQDFHVAELVEDSLALVRPLAEAKGLSLA